MSVGRFFNSAFQRLKNLKINKASMDGDDLLSEGPFRTRRSSFSASVHELDGSEADRSFQRAGEIVRLTKCDDEQFISTAYRYCKRCLRGNWAKCPPDQFTVNYVSGGLTNYLYLCSLPDHIVLNQDEPRKVLIRIYGEIVDQKQRFYEGVVFTLLSERGFGPKTHGVFYSGRIEEFIPHRHLYTRELAIPLLSRLIAETTATFHCMKLPLNKEPVVLWENFEKYLLMVQDIQFQNSEKQKMYDSLMGEYDFVAEYDWLREMLITLNSPVVFCHNDLQEGNILYVKENKKTDILLIDYDYSSYNYRGYDLGNHFCEWMYEYKGEFPDGYKVYVDGYPTKDQQIYFAKHYLAKSTSLKKSFDNGTLDPQKHSCKFELCSPEHLLHEVNRFALASHLYWALWSILQGHVSKIEFNFLKYAQARMTTYRKQKKDLGY